MDIEIESSFLTSLTQTFADSFQQIGYGVVQFIPNIIVAIIIFLIGWVFGAVLGRWVSYVVKSAKVDNALRSAGIEEVLKRAGFGLNAGNFLGGLVKWFVIIGFLIGSLEVLHLTQVTTFLREVVLGYLPQVIAAVLILLVAAVIAEVMQHVVVGGAKAVNLRSAHFLGNVTRWAIWLFAIFAALDQLNVATAIVNGVFQGIVIAVALAVGLSFGLGGQQAASEWIASFQKDLSRRNN